VALLVPPTPEDFARGTLTLIGDPAMRERLGKAAQELAYREYSYDRYLADTEKICNYFSAGPANPVPASANVPASAGPGGDS
jgi:hypothetical protein